LRMRVDPSLIGGLVVEARGQIIDGSVASKLDALKEHLQAVFEERESRLSEPQRSSEKE
jgi:flagellar biosynthesis/type III secretory pathway protein FliH